MRRYVDVRKATELRAQGGGPMRIARELGVGVGTDTLGFETA